MIPATETTHPLTATTLKEVCAECGAPIGDDQDIYVYRITDIDGWTLYDSLCPACSGEGRAQ